jgi:hypothetical protein
MDLSGHKAQPAEVAVPGTTDWLLVGLPVPVSAGLFVQIGEVLAGEERGEVRVHRVPSVVW